MVDAGRKNLRRSPTQHACQKEARRLTRRRAARVLPKRYLLVLEPELLGLLGLVVLLGLELLAPPELLLAPPEVLPLDEGVDEVPPLLEFDLKYASHSERDTCPSLFLSTPATHAGLTQPSAYPTRILPLPSICTSMKSSRFRVFGDPGQLIPPSQMLPRCTGSSPDALTVTHVLPPS